MLAPTRRNPMHSRDPELTRPEVSNRIGQSMLASLDARVGPAWTDARVEEVGLHRSDFADPNGWTGAAFAGRLAIAILDVQEPQQARI